MATLVETRSASSNRLVGLDALRGLAILFMALAGNMPGELPNWMYHGYQAKWVTDASGAWVSASGFQARWGSYTFVDWVFPGFLFAMGAAIPVALAGRLEKGEARWRIALSIIWRTLGLLFFAIYVRQIAPYEWVVKGQSAVWYHHLLAILAFIVPFGLYLRLPRNFSKRQTIAIRLGGFAACVGMIVLATWMGGREIGVDRFDIIIALLAHTYCVCALAMLFLRRSWIWLPVLLAVGLIGHHESINAQKFGDWRFLGGGFSTWMPALQSPDKWLAWLKLDPLWDFTWYQYLFVVAPGMWAGQVLTRRPSTTTSLPATSSQVAVGVAIAALLVCSAVFVGLRNYGVPTVGGWQIMVTPWPVVVIGVPSLVLFFLALKKLRDDTLWRLAVAMVGVLLLGVGLSVLRVDDQFFQGGIKKGPPATLSYHLVSVGVSGVLLVGMTAWADRAKLAGLGIIGLVGQNALMAYIGIRNLIGPILAIAILTPVYKEGSINQFMRLEIFTTPWHRFVWAVICVAVFACFIAICSKRKWVWKV